MESQDAVYCMREICYAATWQDMQPCEPPPFHFITSDKWIGGGWPHNDPNYQKYGSMVIGGAGYGLMDGSGP